MTIKGRLARLERRDLPAPGVVVAIVGECDGRYTGPDGQELTATEVQAMGEQQGTVLVIHEHVVEVSNEHRRADQSA